MPFTTVVDFVNSAYDLVGIGSEGEVLSASMMNKGLDEFNLLINFLSGNNLITAAQITESFALTANKNSYLIGVTSIATPTDFNTSKPFSVESSFVRYTVDGTNNLDTPLTEITREEYNAFPVKTDSGLPQRLFYDPGPTQQANQVGTIYLFPTPDNINSYTLFLISEKPLTPFTSIDTVVTFAPVYHRPLIYNLAMALAARNGVAIHPEVQNIADEGITLLEGLNSSNKSAIVDLGLPAGSGRANILTGV